MKTQLSCWKNLQALCKSLNLQVVAKWRTSTEVRAELASLTDEAEAIQVLAEAEDGLDDSQQARWDELMSDDGLIAKKQAELDSVESVETKKKELAMAKVRSNPVNPMAQNQIDATGDSQSQPKLVAPTRKLKAFKGENAMRDAHDCGMWMRAFLARASGRRDEPAEQIVGKRGWGFQATATEGTDTAGGHTVPDPLSSAFIEFREMVSVARQLSDIRAMTAETLKVPKLTAGPTVQYPGEATATTATDQTWGAVSLTAVERSVLSKVSNPLREDSLINFVDNVISRFGYEMGKQEDNEWINGDGTGTYGGETGLVTALGAAGKKTQGTGSTWGALVLADFTGAMGILPSEHWGSPAWVCSNAFYHTVMLDLLADAGGNTIASLEGGGGRPSFLGYPVFMTDRMPTATATTSTAALFGTFRDGVIIGDRTSIEIATSEHRYFEERVLGIIGVSRYDINVHEGGDGSNAGAYVGLVTGS